MKRSIKKERMQNMIRDYKHPAYSYEIALLNEVRQGNLDQAIEIMTIIRNLERASLSTKPIISKKYSLIIWCSLFTREAMHAGVDYEDAFALSDLIINTIDRKSSLNEIENFEFYMIEEFIDLIQSYGKNKYPYPISKIANYIQVNMTEKLTVQQLASEFNLHPDYLSTKFHQEVGMTLTTYIHTEKVQVAKNFLEKSDANITEIASILNFSCSSYFAKVFKKETQLTPSAYRRMFRV